MNCNKQKKTTIHLFAGAMVRFLELLWFLNNFEDDLHVILRDRKCHEQFPQARNIER